MTDSEKVIKGLECCCASKANRCESNSCPYWKSEICCIDELLADAIAMMKEQEEELYKLDRENQLMLERMAEQPKIVRCKDCKHKGDSFECVLDRDLEEHGSHRTDRYNDWFCANGERREGE